MTCLSSEDPFCIISDESAVLQFGPGLKQDWAGHSSPPLRIVMAPDECLCSVRHLWAYVHLSEPLRSSPALFITTTASQGAAACATLRQWFASVLSGTGVVAPPCSSHAAVACTALACGLADNSIMEAVDWASARTLYENYLRVLPDSALRAGLVQQALIPNS